MRRFRHATILLLGLLVACATPAPSPPSAVTSEAAEYILGPGDTLTVFVHRSPELSAVDLPIRPDGRISIPLAPDVAAAGRTPTALAREIEALLRNYVREPNVTVMVRSFHGPPSRQLRVIGEATQPMSMPYREGITVLDVMIGARGLTRYAAGNRASIIRRGAEPGQTTTIPIRLSDLLRNGDVSQDIAMQAGDTLVIPQGWF